VYKKGAILGGREKARNVVTQFIMNAGRGKRGGKKGFFIFFCIPIVLEKAEKREWKKRGGGLKHIFFKTCRGRRKAKIDLRHFFAVVTKELKKEMKKGEGKGEKESTCSNISFTKSCGQGGRGKRKFTIHCIGGPATTPKIEDGEGKKRGGNQKRFINSSHRCFRAKGIHTRGGGK